MLASSRGESGGLPFSTNRPTPRTTRSRDYFTGAFAGSSSFSSGGGSPPEKDIWGSATKKGNFDENGKFVVTEDEKESLPLESEDHQEDTSSFAATSGDLLEPVSAPEQSESPAQVTDTFGLPAEGGRSTSRFASFGLSDEPISMLADEDSHPPAPHDTLQSGGQFGEDHEDDVLNDILSMTTDQPGLRQMDRLTSRFAAQSLNSDPAQFNTFNPIGTFDSDPSALRRDSGPMPQFYPHPGPPQPGLFEHPVVPAQPALPPAPPQTTRVMIMADKLKWVYKDPHGNVQGPFTGLEMHEWYRGGYFHATLEVKREDDPHFEQLQMLVKRIGNQREPFLVPLPSKTQTQLIPPRSTTTLSGWNTTLFGEGLDDNKWTTPTLQQAALSGTTLTADQQNALERRKQEEQYMLVRQREIAPAPQQIPLPMQQHPLHHPAPFAVPPQPAYPPYGGLHPLPHGVTHHVLTPAPVQVQTLPALDSLRTGAAPTTPPQPAPAQTPVDRQGQGNVPFQAQQNRNFVSPWGAGPLGPLSPSMGQLPQQGSPRLVSDETPAVPFEEERPTSFPTESHFENYEEPELAQIESRKSSVSVKPEILSPLAQAEVAEEVLLEPELEPEALSEEPSLDTTSISPVRAAPWAKKDESAKKASLSLKQIQEMEAKRAAEQARRLSEQRQLLAQQQQATTIPQTVPQPGLPQGSTWGSVAAKGWAGKVTTTPTPSPGKKTMAQIQKEEEEERARLAKSKEVNVTTTPGRGYAGVAATVTPKVFSLDG
jgi:GYF domain